MNIKYYSDIVSPFVQTKSLCHINKLVELQEKDIIAPVTCEIDLTDGFCNNKCKHCFFSTNVKHNPIIMPKKNALSLLDELKKLGVKGVEFTGGGEPLTHPECVEIITYAVEKGFDVGLVTNGFLLHKLDGIIDKMTFVRVSLDAGTAETYNMVHGVDFFDVVMSNIKNIVSKYGGNKIGVGYLILPYNVEDILFAAEKVKEIGVRFIQYRPASLTYEVDEDIWKKAQECVRLAKQYANDHFQVFDAGIKWNHVVTGRHYKQCKTSSIVGVIKANGDIPLCVLKRNETDSIIGNFIREGGFINVWYSKRHEELVDAIEVEKCRKPCKHDSYNIMYESVKEDYLHRNFI